MIGCWAALGGPLGDTLARDLRVGSEEGHREPSEARRGLPRGGHHIGRCPLDDVSRSAAFRLGTSLSDDRDVRSRTRLGCGSRRSRRNLCGSLARGQRLRASDDSMKKTDNLKDDLRPEYDFAAMKGGVRGKYHRRLKVSTNIVRLAPDLAKVFPTDEAVDEALRTGRASQPSSQAGEAAQQGEADEGRGPVILVEWGAQYARRGAVSGRSGQRSSGDRPYASGPAPAFKARRLLHVRSNWKPHLKDRRIRHLGLHLERREPAHQGREERNRRSPASPTTRSAGGWRRSQELSRRSTPTIVQRSSARVQLDSRRRISMPAE